MSYTQSFLEQHTRKSIPFEDEKYYILKKKLFRDLVEYGELCLCALGVIDLLFYKEKSFQYNGERTGAFHYSSYDRIVGSPFFVINLDYRLESEFKEIEKLHLSPSIDIERDILKKFTYEYTEQFVNIQRHILKEIIRFLNLEIDDNVSFKDLKLSYIVHELWDRLAVPPKNPNNTIWLCNQYEIYEKYNIEYEEDVDLDAINAVIAMYFKYTIISIGLIKAYTMNNIFAGYFLNAPLTALSFHFFYKENKKHIYSDKEIIYKEEDKLILDFLCNIVSECKEIDFYIDNTSHISSETQWESLKDLLISCINDFFRLHATDNEFIIDKHTMETMESSFNEYLNGIKSNYRKDTNQDIEKSSSTIEKFLSSNTGLIITKLKDNGLQLSAAALQNDENISRVAGVIHNLLPTAIRFFVSYNTVENFLLNNRQWLINKLT